MGRRTPFSSQPPFGVPWAIQSRHSTAGREGFGGGLLGDRSGVFSGVPGSGAGVGGAGSTCTTAAAACATDDSPSPSNAARGTSAATSARSDTHSHGACPGRR